ncbi:PIN domain-containing protein [Candidatus Poriferisocius sp.]|uniref:PIN domain-containing protein n=1 Tax=Candidatus Poriferisocius sp. TaxID=3101276 RepID=UPI003B014812
MPPQVVVDTMVASAWLANRQVERQVRWLRVLAQALWILPFVVVAEMRFGAEVAGWGLRRRARLENVIARAAVVPPLEDITDAYVDLRAWSVRSGHGLSAKSHEADRWVAAVAIAGELPLATEDSIFDDVPMLRLLDPDGA